MTLSLGWDTWYWFEVSGDRACTKTAIGFRSRPGVGELEQVLEQLELPLPTPKRGKIVVRVAASTVNIDDRHFAEGTMFGGFPIGPRPGPDKPVILGLDFAGVVEAVGPKVEGFGIGDEVFGMVDLLTRHGSWASHVCVSTTNVHHKPEAWSWAEAAASGISGLVALALVRASEPLDAGPIVVVGASGGIGSLTTQILAARGAELIGVCSGANEALVRSLGAARVVDYRRGGFGDQLASEGIRVARVLDVVGGRDVEAEAERILGSEGRFATAVGPHAFVGERKLSFGEHLAQLWHIAWRSMASSIRGPRWRMVGGSRVDWSRFDELIVRPGIRPTIAQCFPPTLEGVREANQLVASHRARGKVVLVPCP